MIIRTKAKKEKDVKAKRRDQRDGDSADEHRDGDEKREKRYLTKNLTDTTRHH